jgi:hypothetical protein
MASYVEQKLLRPLDMSMSSHWQEIFLIKIYLRQNYYMDAWKMQQKRKLI